MDVIRYTFSFSQKSFFAGLQRSSLGIVQKAGVLKESERPYARFWILAGEVRKMR